MESESRPNRKWNSVYKKICAMKTPEICTAGVIDRWESENNSLTESELLMIIRKLRRYGKSQRALEVYEWMSNRRERFKFSTKDEAVILDLIAKVRGAQQAENYFLSLTGEWKDKRTNGALLNVYAEAQMTEKAESLFDQMRSEGHAVSALSYNVLMTMYMKLQEYDKFNSLVLEMIEKKIQLDRISYHIWIWTSGLQGSAEKAEEVLDSMKQDTLVPPNWNTFSLMASVYVRLNQFEKAEEYLRMAEKIIRGQGVRAYHVLLNLYGNIGNKEKVYHVWNLYKSAYPSIQSFGYYAIIRALVRMDDIGSAEKLYEEWRSTKSSYNPIVGNLLLGAYVQNGDSDKALSFFKHMTDIVGQPTSTAWELCAQAHLAQRRISDSLSCWKEAFLRCKFRSWKPRPKNVLAFFNACEEANDNASKDFLADLLNQYGFLKDQSFASSIGLTFDGTGESVGGPSGKHNDSDDDESKMLLNQVTDGI